MDRVTQDQMWARALSVLVTREGIAMVLLTTGGDGAKLGHINESLHEGILLTG
jgi:hypothetical protein